MRTWKNPLDGTLLPTGKARVIPFSTAICVNALVLVGLWLVGILIPPTFQAAKQFVVTRLVSPRTVHASQPSPTEPKGLDSAPPPPPLSQPAIQNPIAAPAKPAIPNPVPSAPVIRTSSHANSAIPEIDTVSSPPRPVDLRLGSPATPNLKKPLAEVQTGGFGDPDGVHGEAKTNRANIGEFGVYDLPSGLGVGNGTAGRKGVTGAISSAGFGTGVATSRKEPANANVQQGLFTDGRVTSNQAKPRQVLESPRSTPVEILSKPKPTYTDSARANKIEGEVLLEVVFTASGEVNVVRVIQGLGYGLEDAAEVAARQIRFKPAQQDGVPVDSTAIVHITFELAS